MSRISRYQESTDKFIKTKSSLRMISSHNKILLDKLTTKFDHLVSIILISILNNRCRKSKLKFHGYYIASGIDIGLSISKIIDRYYYYKNIFGINEINNFIPELVSLMYQSVSGNIDSLKLNVNVETTLKINQYCINYLSNIIGKLTYVNNISSNETINKTDFHGYKFKFKKHKTKYKKFKKINNDKLFEFIENKYGSICKISLIFGWLLGIGDESEISNLEKMGTSLGKMFKIAYDFDNIDIDLEYCINYTHNVVINLGIKESVEIFMDNKAEFIEGILKLGLWSTTIKEILDLIENKINIVIGNVDFDENYEYSDFSSN